MNHGCGLILALTAVAIGLLLSLAVEAYTQDVEIGPVRVDTGNDYLDIGAAAVLIVLVAFLYILVRRLTR